MVVNATSMYNFAVFEGWSKDGGKSMILDVS